RKLDAAAAVLYYLGTHRAVFGFDICLMRLMEVQHCLVEMDPLAKLALFRAYGDVIDLAQAQRSDGQGFDFVELRHERPAEVATLNKTVNGVAEGADGCFDYLAV